MAARKHFTIERRQIVQLKRAAVRAGIREICYVVLGRGSKIGQLIRVPNRARDTVMRHQISPRDVRFARRRKNALNFPLLGLLHTHIISRAYPSAGDVAGYSQGAVLFIYSDHYDEFRAFRLVGDVKKVVEIPVEIIEGHEP